MHQLSETQYLELKTLLWEPNLLNWDETPPSKGYPSFPGMPDYSIFQYEQDNGKHFVIIEFNDPVILPDKRIGHKFKFGGDKRYEPFCEWL